MSRSTRLSGEALFLVYDASGSYLGRRGVRCDFETFGPVRVRVLR